MPHLSRLLNKVHRADAARFIAGLPDESIDFVMTSPPYWGLRDYGAEGQIGLEKHPRDYIARLVAVFADLRRVLAPHGSFFLNLGDTYCSTKGMSAQPGGSRRSIPRPGYAPLVRERNPNRLLKPDGGWLQPKQLLLMPARVAIALQEDGWILRNDIIWHKPNGMPCSAKDRLANKYEHLFHFVKSKRYFYDLDAIRVPHTSLRPQGRSRRTTEGRTARTRRHLLGLRQAGPGYVGHPLGKNPGDVATASNTGRNNKAPYRRNNPHKARLAGVREARHPGGKNPGDVLRCASETRTLAKLIGKRGVTKVPFGSGWTGHPPGGMARILREGDPRWLFPAGKNPGDFWRIATRPFPKMHFAVYPEALCEQPIKAACPVQVCVRCGRPRERITRRVGHTGPLRWDDARPRHGPDYRKRKNRSAWGEQPIYQTTGWTKCRCKKGFRPGIVFDPFTGAGTTLAVAKRVGRHYLGSDLNPEYVKLARQRLAATVRPASSS